MESRRVEVAKDLALDCRIDGPADGEPLLFLHGFPDFSHGWRKQLPYFASRGFRVVAPDLHGYAASSKPKDKRRYHLKSVAADVIKLLDRLGIDKCHVIGHDWGAALTWRLAEDHATRLHTATVMCVPHLDVFFKHIRRNSHGQLLRSWYMGLFQLPWLPEQLFKVKGGRWLADLLAKSSRRGTFTSADLDAYVAAWANPGAPTAMLNWYRANVFGSKDDKNPGEILTPMLIIWGDKDLALNHYMAEDSAAFCRDARVMHLPKGTHWVQLEYPEEVNTAIESHVNARLA